MIFGLNQQDLKEMGSIYTAQEIFQQPKVWSEVIALVAKETKKIKTFLSRFDLKKIKIIFTGSGSSEFAGIILADYLRLRGYDAISNAATDIVSNPAVYFDNSEEPLILISFARSGNSPESLGAINLAEQIVPNLFQIIITCNNEGQLYQKNKNNEKILSLLLPPATNDQSFAMTSSFTSMLLTVFLIFHQDDSSVKNELIDLITKTEKFLNENYRQIVALAQIPAERVVFLGSNILKGYAQEASLKLLELTNGKVVSTFNTALGFRHGPKAIITPNTTVFFFVSQDKYTRQYDLDLLKELYHDNIAGEIIVFDSIIDKAIMTYCNKYLPCALAASNDVISGLQAIVWAQIYALFTALQFKITPDNPCPTGQINRVVKGVKIHPWKK
ncbi:tagatose-6-phosphate ketose/aldose isomerase [Spiroplasma syrphidicola EA-1]|uniref:Tagatose-6-phosphate ketose/aldose isomerase n=1 Tax=Spiroplasma syrphidicola EA-1 TaxID=1276229 RepID=R4U467_9MOLU|nr:SIS domain-containing protein [Spiroplasma syrphidicola]AGM26242.1 tagatose-6-phosphate ketose/aldose isomerase [Spiroplasma syrphidicola EA-1]